jgi:hypothetical protein
MSDITDQTSLLSQPFVEVANALQMFWILKKNWLIERYKIITAVSISK